MRGGLGGCPPRPFPPSGGCTCCAKEDDGIADVAIAARSAVGALEMGGGVSVAQAAAVVMRLISLNAAT
jgi:hypothetical protein